MMHEINLIDRQTDDKYSPTTYHPILKYESELIPNKGDYILYGEYKTFLVDDRVFYVNKTNVVDIYGRIL